MPPTLSPISQAGYHAGCAARHTGKAAVALWSVRAVRYGALACVLGLALSLLPGCSSWSKPVTPPANAGVLEPVADNAAEAKKAAEEAAKAQAERDSKIGASAEIIGRQNAAAPDSPQKPVIAAEAGLIQRTLAVTPSLEDRAAAAERETLMLSGKYAEASKLYTDANARADALNAQIASANAQRDLALNQLETSIATAKQKLEQQQAQHNADMAALETKHNADLAAERKRASDAVMAKQVLYLNIAGAGCILAFGLFVGFGGLAGVTKGWPFGLLSLLCFGLAQIVGQWWFKWAALAVVLVAVGVAAWWIYQHIKAGNLRAAADEKAAKFKAALGDIIPALDNAYDSADGAVREVLDKTVFARLSALMDKQTKTTIHEVRAETSRTKST